MSNPYVPWTKPVHQLPRIALPPRSSPAPAPAAPAAPAVFQQPSVEQLKNGFLDFYCKTPQARGLLSRCWNGYGFNTREAQHDWAIWQAACGFAIGATKQNGGGHG